MNKDMRELVLASSLTSIVIAIYLYAKGHKEAGIFVGLWAPTILGLGSFVHDNQTTIAAASEAAA